MPQARDLSEFHLAGRMISVAESQTVEALGLACCATIGAFTGSRTVGLYLLDRSAPQLLYSRDVPEEFLDDYKTGLGREDPVLETVLGAGRVVDGASLLGAFDWPRSPTFEFLRHWGFNHNMCGPLRVEGRVTGVLYTANKNAACRYTLSLRRQMEILCRASSIALSNIANAGLLTGTHDCARTVRARGSIQSTALDRLPPRSAGVALRLCRGLSNKEIAREMGISDQTVKEHVSTLCRRFGAHNRTELASLLNRV